MNIKILAVGKIKEDYTKSAIKEFEKRNISRKNEKAGANVEKIDLMVEGRDYEVNVFPSRIDIPPFMRRVHEFSDADFQKIDQVDIGLGVEIEFSGDSMRSFMDQLIIVDSFIQVYSFRILK